MLIRGQGMVLLAAKGSVQ